MNNEQLMRRAIALSEESVRNGGGPFGAVIARKGVIVAEASNSVTIDNDPTAHAEVNCIRRAAEMALYFFQPMTQRRFCVVNEAKVMYHRHQPTAFIAAAVRHREKGANGLRA